MGYLLRDSIEHRSQASPGACYRRLLASDDVGLWWRGVSSTLSGASPWEPGCKLSLRAWPGFLAWEAEIKEIVPEQLVEVYYTGGDLRGAESWEFEPVGSGSRLVHRWRGVEAATPKARLIASALGPRVYQVLFGPALSGLARAAST
jgi:hypothetical protein